MVQIAAKSLLQDRLRFALSLGGVALSIMLVVLLVGMYLGVNRQITAYLDNTGADVLIAQAGTRNFLGARSVISEDAEQRAARTEGVRSAIPVISQYAVVDVGTRKEFSLLIGFYPEQGGGPWEMVEGRAAPGEGEVVADYAVAKARGLGLGDRVEILGKDFEVVGLSGGTSSWMTGTFFMRYGAASDLVASRGQPSFLLVNVERSADPGVVARRLEQRLGDVTVTTRAAVNRNDRLLYARILNGPMGFMVLAAFLIGTAVVGLTIYTAAAERVREYGTLKAIGIGNRQLYRIVFQQALLTTVSGYVAGVGLAAAARWAIPLVNPRFMVVIEPPVVAGLALLSLAMGVLAGFIPARAIAVIDPAVAFRRGA